MKSLRKPINSNQSFALWIVLLMFAIFFVLLPLVHRGMPVTDDGDWMVIRLSAFYQSLREGQFPTRFLGRLNNSYGYPVANFLYPGFMYIGSFIHIVGFSFQDTVKLILGLSVIVSSISMYLWLRSAFPLLPAVIGASSFIVSPYIVFDIYKRGSVGELLAISFGTLVLAAVSQRKRLFIGFGICALLVSHNTVGLLFLVLIGGYLWAKKYYLYYIDCIFGVVMATFFWFPALYEQRYVVFASTVISNPFRYFAIDNYSSIFPWGFLIAAMTTIGLYAYTKKIPKDVQLALILFGSTVALATPISAPLWTFEPFVKIVQFPYRLLTIAGVGGAWLVAYCVFSSKKFAPFAGVMLFFGFILTSLGIVKSVTYQNKPDGFYSTNEATTTVANEYMPRWVKRTPEKRSSERMIVHDGEGIVVLRKNTSQTIEADVALPTRSLVQVNTVDYPGWGVLANGIKQKILHDNEYGFIRFYLDPGAYRVLVQFRETPLRFLADIISLIAALSYGIFLLETKRHQGRHG